MKKQILLFCLGLTLSSTTLLHKATIPGMAATRTATMNH